MNIRPSIYWVITAALVVGVISLGAIFAPVLAHTVEKGNILVIHPWVEPSGGNDTLAHPTISNEGERALVLLRVETPVAEKVEVLRKGRPVTTLPIRGGDIIAFDSPDAQIKLVNLKQPLLEGTHFPARLVFTRNITVDLEMVVGQDTMLPDRNVSGVDMNPNDERDREDRK